MYINVYIYNIYIYIYISYIIIIYDLCNVNNLIKRMCSPCFLCNIQNIWQLWCIFEQVNRDSRQNSSLFCFYTTYWSHKYFPINVFYSIWFKRNWWCNQPSPKLLNIFIHSIRIFLKLPKICHTVCWLIQNELLSKCTKYNLLVL